MTTQEFDKAVAAFVLAYRTGDLRADDEGWITVNGTHVLLNESGKAQSGGGLKGKTFATAKSTKRGEKGIDALNTRVKESYGKGSYTDTLKEIRNSAKELPVGGKINIGNTAFEKVGENEYKYEWNPEAHPGEYATVTENYVVNSCDPHDVDKAPTFEKGSDLPKSGSEKAEEPDKENGMKLYQKFIEGGSSEVHKALGVDMLGGGKYDPEAVDEKAARDIDTVFTPSSGAKPLYKGLPMTQEEIDDIKNGKAFLNPTISSTSSDVNTARDYASNAYETEDQIPVVMKIKVEDGTPVADARQLLGNSGMKGYEKETTVGRNTEWKYGKVKNVGDDDDPFYEVEVTVSPTQEKKKAKDGRYDSAYDEWLEENLDKFEDDDAERDFAQWKDGNGAKPRDCDSFDEVEDMWTEYKRKLMDRRTDSDGDAFLRKDDCNDTAPEKESAFLQKDDEGNIWAIRGREVIGEVSEDDLAKGGFQTDEGWITINGTHILTDKEGNLTGKVGEKINETSESSGEKSSEPKLSGEMTPKQTGYDLDLNDGFQDFVRKNMGNRRNPRLLYDFYNSAEKEGKDGKEEVKDEYYKTRLSMCTKGLKEISKDEADEILYDNLHQGTVQAWFREYNHEAKDALIAQMTRSPEVHNAALNIMYDNYKYQCKDEGKDPLPYNKFLVTPIKMYRGGSGKEYDKAGTFSSYTFDKKVAEKFTGSDVGQGASYDPNGVVYEAEIRPIDTYGSVFSNGEAEICVPRMIAPNKNRDSAFDSRGPKKRIFARREKKMIAPKELIASMWVCANKYISEKLLDKVANSDIININKKQRTDAGPVEWITLENGEHIPLNESGAAIGGAGGWAKGKDFSSAESSKQKKEKLRKKRQVHEHKKRVYPTSKTTPDTENEKEAVVGKAPDPVEKAKPEKEKPEEKKEQTKKATEAEESKETKTEENRESTEKTAEHEVGTVEKPSAKGENVPCTGFRSKGAAIRHRKHMPEFGFETDEEYAKAAINFIKQPVGGDIDGYKRSNGQIVRFNRKTGEMGIGVPGREVVTYYKAKFNKELGKSNIEIANRYFDSRKKEEEYEDDDK